MYFVIRMSNVLYVHGTVSFLWTRTPENSLRRIFFNFLEQHKQHRTQQHYKLAVTSDPLHITQWFLKDLTETIEGLRKDRILNRNWFEMIFMENVEFSWKKMPNATKKIPSIRCNMSGGLYDDHLWLLLGAGAGNGRSSEVWKYSIKNGEWSYVSYSGDAPSPRDGHSATYVGDGKFVVFGGQGEPISNNKSSRIGDQASKTRTLLAREVFNDIYEFDCKENVWTIVHPSGGPPPTSRRQHSANFISYDDDQQLGTSPEERATISTTRSTSYRSVFGTSTNNESRKMKISSKVPNNSILIYGGCGIEPTKKSEQVYNDLWSYVVETKTWIPLQSRGHVPRPQSGHKSEVVGDILIVIGGIAATACTLSKSDQVFSDTLCSMTSDVMTLNIRTLTWTYLDTKDALGRPMKLSLYGHSVCTDSAANKGSVLIFGGKESSETKEYETKRVLSTRHFWRLDATSGVVEPVTTKDSPPENRYGHIAVSLEIDPYTPEIRTSSSRRNSAQSIRADPIMLLFGGSGLEAGGYLEPEVYALVRTVRTEIEDFEKSQKSSIKEEFSRSRSKSAGTKRSGRFENQKDENNLEQEQGREDNFLEQHRNGTYMNRNGTGSTDKRFEKSIWQRMHENGNGPLQTGGIPMVIGKLPGDCWKELKLALSYPTTKRDSTLKFTTPAVLTGSKGDGSDRDLLPDSVRIAKDLEKDIKEMALCSNQRDNKRQSLAGRLLIPENEHNLENSNAYKATRGLDNSIKMLKTLGTGRGTKTMLLMKNEELHQKNIVYKSLKVNNPESQNLVPLDEQKKRGKKIKVLSEKLLPLIKGIDRNTVMDLYLNKFCVDEVNENNKKNTVTFHEDALQEKKTKNW